MTEQQLAGAQVAGLFVGERHLGPAQAVRAVGSRLQIDELNPAVDQTGILPCGDVVATAATARERSVISASTATRQPRRQCLAGWLGDLERHGPARLLLDHGGPRPEYTAWRNIAHGQTYQIAGAKLCVDRTVEHR